MNIDFRGYKEEQLLCVNVGKRSLHAASKADDESMRKQSLEGAQWIPACLLEIVPRQVVRGLLPQDDIREMIKQAVRLPAANLAMIELEGMNLLGIKPSSAELKNTTLVSEFIPHVL